MLLASVRSARPRTRRLAVVAVVAAVLLAPILGPAVAPAGAQGEAVIVVQGRGWGHGRGMSQYGALGYAVDHGWDWRQILQHFYGNTTEGMTGGGGGAPVAGAVGVGVSRQAGYWVVTSGGAVVARDGASHHGSMAGQPLAAPVLGLAPASGGYWLVAADGGIFSFGSAAFHGSTGGMRLNQPVVGMASTPSGRGYWLVARDGGIFAFGDARFAGSTGGMRLNQPIVGMAATPTGQGYWLVASDGGIFAFGDARFHGSTGGIRLNQPVVGMAATTTGLGYRLVGRDGGVFNFGDAPLHGSLPGRGVGAVAVGIAPSRGGNGYWIVTGDGRAHAFGDASVAITVDLTAQVGQDLIVWRPNGGLQTNAGGGLAPAWRVRNAGSGWLVDRGQTCAGPWTQVTPQPVPSASLEISAADPRDGSGDHRDLLGLCRSDGIRFYRGQLHAYRDGSTMRARNALDLELYLQGVVPRESPASWADLGGGRGIDAVAAQAVAARSYAWAENRRAGAKTCDTTSCQVYGGAFLLVGSSLTALEDARSNEAVRMTGGVIRLLNGQAARTEFSSSSGGQTATNVFPGVRDEGDDIAANRLHTWTEHVRVSAVQAAWPSIGSLVGIQVLSRDGLGEWGGRALQVRIVGTAGSVDVTGDTFRSRLADSAACTKVGTSNLPQCIKSTYINVVGGPVLAPASTGAQPVEVPSGHAAAGIPEERHPAHA